MIKVKLTEVLRDLSFRGGEPPVTLAKLSEESGVSKKTLYNCTKSGDISLAALSKIIVALADIYGALIESDEGPPKNFLLKELLYWDDIKIEEEELVEAPFK